MQAIGRQPQRAPDGARVQLAVLGSSARADEAWSMGMQLLHRPSGMQVALPAGLQLDNHALLWTD